METITMGEPTDDLKKQWLYELAQQEIDMVLDGAPSVNLPFDAVKTLCIACWIRGASWQRQQSSATGNPNV